MDLRETTAPLNFDALRERVKLFDPIITKIAPFCAIVAANPERQNFGRHAQLTTAEMFSINVALFSSLAAARAWLSQW